MEWSHCNSLSLTPKGDWLLSFRRLSMIAEVSAKSGKIKWKWGDGTTAHQHDAKYSSADTITIFDNGVHRRKHGFLARHRDQRENARDRLGVCRRSAVLVLHVHGRQRGSSAERQHADLRVGEGTVLRGDAQQEGRVGVHQSVVRLEPPPRRTHEHRVSRTPIRRRSSGARRVAISTRSATPI